MAPPKSTGLTFYDRSYCYWRGAFVRVLHWRVASDGRMMVVVKETGRVFNGVAFVPEEELRES